MQNACIFLHIIEHVVDEVVHISVFVKFTMDEPLQDDPLSPRDEVSKRWMKVQPIALVIQLHFDGFRV